MKTKILFNAILAGFILLALPGCNQKSSKKPSGEKAAASIDTVAFRNKVGELIRQSPKGVATFEFLKSIGVSYINGLTIPLANVDKYETRQDLAMAAGAFGADMNYSALSKRLDIAAQEGDAVTRILGKLGIVNNMPETVKDLESVSKFADNQDSVDAYVARVMKVYHQEQNANSPEIYPLIFVGGNIEIFYILTQLTLYSGDNKAMIERLSGQGALAKTMLGLLEILSADESIKPYYEKMKPIVNYFNEHPVFTEKELKEIAPMIASIRNDMLM